MAGYLRCECLEIYSDWPRGDGDGVWRGDRSVGSCTLIVRSELPVCVFFFRLASALVYLCEERQKELSVLHVYQLGAVSSRMHEKSLKC